MKAEDINFSNSNDDQDDIMMLTKKNIDLEALVQNLKDIVKAQEEALEMAQEIHILLKLKESAIKMYVNRLEQELGYDEEE
jgi:hypothetical protein